MRDKRRVLTVASTFLLAAATGHLMQNGANLTGRISSMGASTEPVGITTVAATTTDIPKLPGLPDFRPISLGTDTGLGIRVAALDKGHVTPAVVSDGAFDAFGLSCTDDITATAQPGAMIRVNLAASCRPNEAAVLRHAGMAVSVVTGPDGGAQITLPALKPQAAVRVEFADGKVLEAATEVPEVAALNRMVLQWQDTAALSLHVLKPGARIGGKGEMNAAEPGLVAVAGDYLTRVGDSAAPVPMLAEVYTFPAADTERRIVIQAEVTRWNCGQTAEGKAMVLNAGESAAVHTDVFFAMPTCDAVGDFVQMMPDLDQIRIASR